MCSRRRRLWVQKMLRLVSNHLNNQHGKSLIEVMIATVVGCIVVGSVAQILVAGQSSSAAQTDKQMLHQALYRTLNYLKRDIRRAGYNGAQSDALLLSGADNVLELNFSSDPLFNFSSLEYAYQTSDNHYVLVEVSNLPPDKTLSICRKTTLLPPNKSGCPASFSLLDKKQIEVTRFNVTSYPKVTSSAKSSLLEIELGLRSLATSNTVTDSIFVAQRNSQ